MGFVVQYEVIILIWQRPKIDEEIQGYIGFKYWMVIGSLELCHQLGDVRSSFILYKCTSSKGISQLNIDTFGDFKFSIQVHPTKKKGTSLDQLHKGPN